MSDTANSHMHHKILVFDSGVGGLTILDDIRRPLPCCDYVYACDNQAFPYGKKNEEELVLRIDTVLKALIARIQPDIVVIACNTASTIALPKIRAHFTRPVVGVVPAIKPAALSSTSKVIGLLATPGTATRPYTQQLIEDFARGCTVIPVGSSRLVSLAEACFRGIQPDLDEIASIIAPLFENPATDTVVLACTHFPLLKEYLEKAAPRPVTWIDSGEAIARRVASFTGTCENTEQYNAGFSAWLTAENDDLSLSLRSHGATRIEILNLYE